MVLTINANYTFWTPISFWNFLRGYDCTILASEGEGYDCKIVGRETPENGTEATVLEFFNFSEKSFLKSAIKSKNLVYMGLEKFFGNSFRRVVAERVQESEGGGKFLVSTRYKGIFSASGEWARLHDCGLKGGGGKIARSPTKSNPGIPGPVPSSFS